MRPLCSTLVATLAVAAFAGGAHAEDSGIMGFTTGITAEEVLSRARARNLDCKWWDLNVPKACVDTKTGDLVTFYWTWRIRPRVLRQLQLTFKSRNKPNEVADALSKEHQVDYTVIGLYRAFEWKIGGTATLSLVKNDGDDYTLDLIDDELVRKDR